MEKGEKGAVLEYLSRCKSFWKSGADTLDAWSAAIRGGNTPDFGGMPSYRPPRESNGTL